MQYYACNKKNPLNYGISNTPTGGSAMRHTKDQKNSTERIIAMARQFLGNYTANMSKPVQRFVFQMLYGIIVSRSVIVQKIAVCLDEKIKLKKLCDRLYRHLSRCSVLHELLMDAQIRHVSSQIRSDSAIMVDLSDINKDGATKMEGLDKVWDGSASKANTGYFTVQASVCHYTNPQSVSLLFSDIFSLEKENTSENDKILDCIHRVMINSDNRGIFVMDRGMDSIIILNDLIENDTSFIIRGDSRHLLFNGKRMSYREIAEGMQLTYKVTSKKRTFKAGIVPVKLILPNGEENKNQRKKTADLYLVVALEPDRSFVYYLCRFRDQYRDLQMVNMVIRYYGLRWSIEEIHRQIKQDFNWEAIQLMKYWSLKNMNALLWLSASFLYNEIRRITPLLVQIFKNRMVYRNDLKEKDKNLMYRLTDLISDLLSKFHVTRLIKCRKQKQKTHCDDQEQLYLCFDVL